MEHKIERALNFKISIWNLKQMFTTVFIAIDSMDGFLEVFHLSLIWSCLCLSLSREFPSVARNGHIPYKSLTKSSEGKYHSPWWLPAIFQRKSRLADGEGFSLISAREHPWGLQKKKKKMAFNSKIPFSCSHFALCRKKPSKHNLM